MVQRTIYLFFFIFLAIFLSPIPSRSYQLILDGEDPVLHVDTSRWKLDKTGSYYRSFKFSVTSTGSGNSHAIWTIDGIPSGQYYIEFYVDNGDYAANAEYIIEDEYSISTVIRSQNYIGAGWHSLATTQFLNAGRIKQTDHWTGAGSKVIADALRFTHLGIPVKPTVNVTGPAITIVIDDLGSLNPNDTTTYTAQLFDQCSEFSYAILPFQSYTQQVLQSAQSKGIHTLLHQAMQYVGQPDYDPVDTTRLYTGMTDSEITTIFNRNLNSVTPYVSGASNHQGSRFSEYGHGMQLVMDILKSRNMVYYDSRTITDSVAYDIAKETGLLTAERDLFIDGNSIQETRDYVFSIATQALYSPNYNYLCIGHQRTNTVPALLGIISQLTSIGVQVKPLLRNMSYVMESDFQPPGSSYLMTGSWQTTARDMISTECRDGNSYFINNLSKGTAQFIPYLPRDGRYQVYLGFCSGTENCDSTKITIQAVDGTYSMILNQSVDPNRWHYIGTYSFSSGILGFLMLDNSLCTTPSHQLKADSLKLVYDGYLPVAVNDWMFY